MVSDAVHTLVGPFGVELYVTDVTNFTGRGDIFPEHKRHISMVLMIAFRAPRRSEHERPALRSPRLREK